uniref:Uncharacterized protein n=1 Tax=Caudovirales sp. ctUL28 TaxID=2826778 RepID=A0A8S5MVY5_9CAUD|nr:MAG TPA: hypothetical protein [Caudovirales sp. ctUL28]
MSSSHPAPCPQRFPNKVNIPYIVSMHGSCYNRMIGTNKKRITSLRFYHWLVVSCDESTNTIYLTPSYFYVLARL